LEVKNDFTQVVGLVKAHRDATKMTISEHIISNVNNGGAIMGIPGTLLGVSTAGLNPTAAL
jgi:hypothetical protein